MERFAGVRGSSTRLFPHISGLPRNLQNGRKLKNTLSGSLSWRTMTYQWKISRLVACQNCMFLLPWYSMDVYYRFPRYWCNVINIAHNKILLYIAWPFLIKSCMYAWWNSTSYASRCDLGVGHSTTYRWVSGLFVDRLSTNSILSRTWLTQFIIIKFIIMNVNGGGLKYHLHLWALQIMQLWLGGNYK